MSWHTKEDVVDDLAKVMGNEINDFDEQYIVRGEQPPPPACTSNEVGDDELYLKMHEEIGDRTMNEDCRGPDLSGITEMLRMVDKFNSSSNIENNQVSTQNSNITGISITKLSVNVPDFVPKNDINIEINKNDMLCLEKTVEQAKIKEISDKLKSKIENSSKTNNLKMKRERNLAIASLLKLHSKENDFADEAMPKLITPEHFQKNSSTNLNDKSSQTSLKKVMAIRPLLHVESDDNSLEITEGANSMNHELEESVAKVNSWLNKGSGTEPQSRCPALYLGPVTFRKKEIKKPDTPNSGVSDKSPKRTMDNPFTPSEFADKLTQSYMERVKAKEDKSLNIWDKLERDLKVKDEKKLLKYNLSPQQSSGERSNGSQS